MSWPSTDRKPFALRIFSLRNLALCGAALALGACGADTATPTFHAEGNPPLLSDWGQLSVSGSSLSLPGDVLPYDLNTALFTDYAHKLRTVWLPDGTTASYREGDVLDFPVGTVISKTFYYPRGGQDWDEVARTENDQHDFRDGSLDLDNVRLIETRLLVHRETGWVAIPYRWNEDQSDAVLHRTGSIIPLTLVDEAGAREDFNYVMPNVNQCASCHAPDSNTREIAPIGPKPRHLNREFDYESGSANQLVQMVALGMLDAHPPIEDMPRNAAWGDDMASLEARARSYLDINCSHCHSPVGPADTSGLFLEPDTPTGPNLGLCKLPIAAGRGTGNRPYGIVPGEPHNSILTYRLDSVVPDVMMPEIGRSTIHVEGLELVEAWIAELEGSCA